MAKRINFEQLLDLQDHAYFLKTEDGTLRHFSADDADDTMERLGDMSETDTFRETEWVGGDWVFEIRKDAEGPYLAFSASEGRFWDKLQIVPKPCYAIETDDRYPKEGQVALVDFLIEDDPDKGLKVLHECIWYAEDKEWWYPSGAPVAGLKALKWRLIFDLEQILNQSPS